MAGITYNKKFWFGFNIRMTDYATIKKQYEDTKPIQGRRLKHGLDQRPLSVRRRTWETWYKDEAGNYGMAFRQSYAQTTYNQDTKKHECTGYHDNVNPFLMMNPQGALTFYPKWMNSYTTWDMLSALLPEGIRFCKYGSKQYFRVAQPDGEDKYFLITGLNMGFVPYESDGKRYYMATSGVVSEEKILVDRTKAKLYRQEFQAFLNYFQPMSDMLGIGIEEANGWAKRREAETFLTTKDWLVRKDGEEYGEKWIDAVEAFMRTNVQSQHRWIEDGNGGNKHHWEHSFPSASLLRAKYRGETFYRVVKPYTRVPMPIGVPFLPNNRSL